MSSGELGIACCEADQPQHFRFASHLRRLLAWRWFPIVCGFVGLLLTLPSLTVGLVADDYYHQASLCGSTLYGVRLTTPGDMFRFFDGDSVRNRQLMDIGFLPWWTDERIKGAFWRPLTVFTHWIDVQLWGGLTWLMHAHSMLWFAALVTVVAAFYRRLMQPVWLAGLAALFFAIDDARGMLVGFLANRNALVAGFFGVSALLLHDRWRRDAWRPAGIIAPLLLALSLLSAEAGIGTCAYLGAYMLFLDRAAWRDRLLSMAPYVVIVVIWRLSWSGLGYGVAHAGLYVDPLQEPVRFLGAVFERAPLLLLGQWVGPPAEINVLLSDSAQRIHLVAAWVVLIVLGILFAPLLRRDRIARFWAGGMLLSLIPCCATFAADRMLLFAGIGASALLSQFLHGVFTRGAWQPSAKAWRIPALSIGCVFIGLHGVVAPLGLALRSGYPLGPVPAAFAQYAQMDLGTDIAQQDQILVNPPSQMHATYINFRRERAGLPIPRRQRVLAPVQDKVTLTRTDERTLVIRPNNGFLSGLLDDLFRDENRPLTLGQRIELTGLTLEIDALTNDGRPAVITFTFAVPLEDPSLYWMQWRDRAYQTFVPPAIGETIELDAVSDPL